MCVVNDFVKTYYWQILSSDMLLSVWCIIKASKQNSSETQILFSDKYMDNTSLETETFIGKKCSLWRKSNTVCRHFFTLCFFFYLTLYLFYYNAHNVIKEDSHFPISCFVHKYIFILNDKTDSWKFVNKQLNFEFEVKVLLFFAMLFFAKNKIKTFRLIPNMHTGSYFLF